VACCVSSPTAHPMCALRPSQLQQE
jgi:hypothetical protein